MNFSTLIKIYTTKSLAQKERLIENYEKRVEEQRQRDLQQNQQMQQQQMQMQAQLEQAKMQQEYMMHQEDNQTKILVAKINGVAEEQRMSIMNHDNSEANALEIAKREEEARQFDAKLKLEQQKHQDDVRLREKQINKQTTKK